MVQGGGGRDLYSPFTSVVDPGLDLCHKCGNKSDKDPGYEKAPNIKMKNRRIF